MNAPIRWAFHFHACHLQQLALQVLQLAQLFWVFPPFFFPRIPRFPLMGGHYAQL